MESGYPPPKDQERFSIFFHLSFWIIIFFLYALQFPRWIYLSDAEEKIKNSLESESRKEIRVLIENPKEKSPKEKKEMVFLSNQEMKARGRLTKEKGFEALSRDDVLEWNEEILVPRNAVIKTFRGTDFQITLAALQSPLKNMERTVHSASVLRKIPTHYQFRDRFALAWDLTGSPRIPSKDFKNFQFFRSMLEKIKGNWAPPGGIPYPIYDDDYHSMSATPGYTRFSSFPNQDVRIVFLIDERGNVLDAKVHQSLGYRSLDKSLLDAIFFSRNFGLPPAELIKDGTVVIPVIFRIITH